MRSLPRKPNFARYLREARIRRHLTVAEVAEQVGVSTRIYIFLGNRSLSAARCQPQCVVQGAKAADQGHEGDRCGVISTDRRDRADRLGF